MWLEPLFTAASATAAAGWAVLLFGRRWPRFQKASCAVAIPVLLALAYVALYPALYARSPGGYTSIDALSTLLNADRGILLGAWLHILAFDLLIGWWIGHDARERTIPVLAVVPSQLLTFLFGPLGWLTYMLVRLWMLRDTVRLRSPARGN